MSVTVFASVYIGSFEISLKIFEFSQKNKMKEIDHVRAHLDLGKESYQNDRIGYELVDDLCEILCEFKNIMNGYKVDYYEAYVSAVVRDVSNEAFVLDQIKLRTGLDIKVISNSEHRFISYKSVAARDKFADMIQTSAAVIDIGGASIQITLFQNGQLITTQHMEVGTARLRSILYKPGVPEESYKKQLEEYLNKKFEVLKSLYFKDGVDCIIFMNDYGLELVNKIEKDNKIDNIIKGEKFEKYLEKLQKKSVSDMIRELDVPDERDSLLVPSLMLFKTLVSNFKASKIWIPGVDINDGIAYDYAEKNHFIKASHDFKADIISAAKYMSAHYNSHSPHIEALDVLSMKIFDVLKKNNGLTDRDKLLLEVAVILHDCGKYISMVNSAQCAYEIIMASEIIGLTHAEREIVALTVLYNSIQLDLYEDLSDRIDYGSYIKVAKLSAILRVANALDQSHMQKFKNVKTSLKGRELIITLEVFEDISLEQALFENKIAYFENVFSIKPVLKQKRIYDV